MKKALLVLSPALIALILLAQIDDDLSEGANHLINRLDFNGSSNAYLFLLGIYAAEHEKPIDVGKTMLAEFRKSEADYTYDIVHYDASKKMTLPTGELFCKTWEVDCVAKLFTLEFDANGLANEHKVLIERANQFLDFSEFKTLAKPTHYEEYPPYQYIRAAERIKILKSISSYKNGQTEQAIESLLSQMTALRKSLALQDNLIGKLVFLINLSDVIDVTSVILHQEGIQIDPLPTLSVQEKSFYNITPREFGLVYYGLKNLDENRDLLEIGEHTPNWISRILLKPNMTINAVTPNYLWFDYLSQLSPAAFAIEATKESPNSPPNSALRNYLGNKLIAERANFEIYVARFSDLEVKIAIFNHQHSSNSTHGSDTIVVESPYYGEQETKIENRRICLNGPFEDERNLRCLQVAI